MKRGDKEVYKAIKEKFGTIKLGDEIFSDREYWSAIPVDEGGNPHELSRSNPDVLPESAGFFYQSPPTEEQEAHLEAVKKARLTLQQRVILDLLATGATLEAAGAKIGISKASAANSLLRARAKIQKILAIQKARRGQ